MLEEHAETAADGALRDDVGSVKILAEETDASGARTQQAEHFAQQRRLAAARAAEQAENLAGLDAQVELAMHVLAGKDGIDAAQFDDRRRAHNCGMPICRVRTANTASTRMTAVIAVTTALVVLADRLSVLGLTRKPK